MAVIKFTTDTELEVIETLDEEGEIDSYSLELFPKDEEVECDFVSDTQIQFGDGSIAFVDGSMYRLIKE
jgi:hypothetical protein